MVAYFVKVAPISENVSSILGTNATGSFIAIVIEFLSNNYYGNNVLN